MENDIATGLLTVGKLQPVALIFLRNWQKNRKTKM